MKIRLKQGFSEELTELFISVFSQLGIKTDKEPWKCNCGACHSEYITLDLPDTFALKKSSAFEVIKEERSKHGN